MSDFETLDRLVDLGCEHRRMQELGADMYLGASALSRSVARLERAGLVVRSLREADRRGVFVDVTDHGLTMNCMPPHARRTRPCSPSFWRQAAPMADGQPQPINEPS
ncbi:MAG: MarR family winged helix-turn-helix transcriptional regulator [Haloechinothrix sp.]